MPKQPAANTMPMIDQIATAIAQADGADIRADPARYRRLALAPLMQDGKVHPNIFVTIPLLVAYI